jgi:hypothetical protein
MPYQVDMDQVDELLVKIMEHKIAGVTSASVVYSWMGRRIQLLQSELNLVSSILVSQTHLGLL